MVGCAKRDKRAFICFVFEYCVRWDDGLGAGVAVWVDAFLVSDAMTTAKFRQKRGDFREIR